MATFKYYLDTRQNLKDGLYPIRLRISVKSQGAYFSTDVKVDKSNWDPVKQQVKTLPNKDKINSFLRYFLVQHENAFMELKMETSVRNLSVFQLRDAISAKVNGEDVTLHNFIEYYEKIASTKGAQTSAMYLRTLSKIRKYFPGADKLTLHDINEDWIQKFINMMKEEDNKHNSIVIHISHVRSVILAAKDDELVTKNPFTKFELSPQKTIKRNLPVEELRNLFNADVTDSVKKAVDCFKLEFLLVGINSVDLLALKKKNLADGRISYYRSKTKRLYNIKVEPEAMELINKYKGEGDDLLIYRKKHKTNMKLTTWMNKQLKHIDGKLSSYYARHTWATIAHSLGIPKDTISLALGHSFGVSVTDTYIDYDAEKVDEANRKVIDWVLYGIR